jgi:hypothetical protein
MIKLIVTGKALAELLAAHPEVEIELVKNASEQVAEALKRKIVKAGDIGGIVDRISKDVDRQLMSRYTMPDMVKKEIDALVANRAEYHVSQATTKRIRDHIANDITTWGKNAESRLGKTISEIVEREVLSYLKAAKSIGR